MRLPKQTSRGYRVALRPAGPIRSPLTIAPRLHPGAGAHRPIFGRSGLSIRDRAADSRRLLEPVWPRRFIPGNTDAGRAFVFWFPDRSLRGGTEPLRRAETPGRALCTRSAFSLATKRKSSSFALPVRDRGVVRDHPLLPTNSSIVKRRAALSRSGVDRELVPTRSLTRSAINSPSRPRRGRDRGHALDTGDRRPPQRGRRESRSRRLWHGRLP